MKKILIGLLALSAVSMAASEGIATSQSATAKGTFTNRFGINYGLNASEKWDKKDETKYDIHDDSYGLNYKLLYNVTSKFRWGGEVGYDNVNYSSEAKKNDFNDGSSAGIFTIGFTGEYDLYQGSVAAMYINGSLGVAANELKMDKYADKDGGIHSTTLNARSYMKLGLGARFNNGIGLEVGERVIGYQLEGEGVKDQVLTSSSAYFELNYSF